MKMLSLLYRMFKARITALILLVGITANVHADIEFYSVDAAPIELNDDLGDTFNYTFSAQFNSFCSSGCVGYQAYGLGLSAYLDGLGAGGLGEYIGSTVTVTAPDSGGLFTNTFDLGSYTGPWEPESSVLPPPVMVAEYALVLKKKGLQALYQQGENLEFYIRGVNMKHSSDYDQMKVSIPVENPPRVKISGLDDVVLDASSASGNVYEKDEDFCIHVSESPYWYSLSVETDNPSTDGFQLKYSPESGEASYVPYNVGFRYNESEIGDLIWLTGSGEVNGTFIGSSYESCNNIDNARFRIQVNIEDADQVPMGIYEDRMYVTVEAQ